MKSISALERPAERSHTINWQDPMITARAAMELSGLEALEKIRAGELPPPPIMILMNGRMAKLSEGRVVFEAEPAEYHFNPIGSVHGGYAATMLDTAMACSIHSCLPAGVGYTTLEIKINYVRALTDRVGIVHCEGTAIHVGGRIATAEGRIVDDAGPVCPWHDNLSASATLECVFPIDKSEARPARL